MQVSFFRGINLYEIAYAIGLLNKSYCGRLTSGNYSGGVRCEDILVRIAFQYLNQATNGARMQEAIGFINDNYPWRFRCHYCM